MKLLLLLVQVSLTLILYVVILAQSAELDKCAAKSRQERTRYLEYLSSLTDRYTKQLEQDGVLDDPCSEFIRSRDCPTCEYGSILEMRKDLCQQKKERERVKAESL